MGARNQVVRHYTDPSRLTPKEAEIYYLHTQGKTRQEIAELLGITLGRVGRAINISREKLGGVK